MISYCITMFLLQKETWHHILLSIGNISLSFPGGSVVKNLPANAGDEGLIPESGRSCGEGNDPYSSVYAWKIPWTEEPDGLQSMGLQRVGYDLVTEQQQEYQFR